MAGTPGRARRASSRYARESVRLSEHLRAQRERVDLTQEQLAVAANVSVSTVRKIERGEVVEPGYFTISALARALGISLDDLNP
ncbi:MAG: family transcriptional regulator [Gemmatimonadales bacterium]|jgi:transcriptional regulator with XRE-family HTH domain|nr:family transcriptional regulator [Gemmatimonadales bacterium]